MFLFHDDKSVNTDSVTNVVLEHNKIIFNLDYATSMPDNEDRLIADYVYFYFDNDQEMDECIAKIDRLGWIRSKNPRNNRIVNPNNISFIKFEKTNRGGHQMNRIIMNLRTSISFSRDIYTKTSDFVYFEHDDTEEFESECTRITKFLEEK